MTLPPVASKLPLASYLPVLTVKVPSISDAPVTVAVFVEISNSPAVTVNPPVTAKLDPTSAS